MSRNLKTTIGGACMIVAGLAGIGMSISGVSSTDMEVHFGLIAGGVALLAARDAGTGSDTPPA